MALPRRLRRSTSGRNSYGQGTAFGVTTPVLQSCVVALNSADSAGGGSGTPTEGNWLFAIVTWTQDPALAETHVNVGDDIHSWWRQFPASSISGKTRTSIAYTPNIARSVTNVYVAPDSQVAAINVLVVEISGLGPWDTLAGTAGNYAAAATSLALSQNASGATFFIGATGGDNVTSGQAFLPSGWTGLATLTQTDGTDHLCDNILTAAFLPSTSSNQSVSGTASSAENMSGFILAVAVEGTDPIPAGGNPNWPFVKFEAAFGSGFNTPPSEMTWTDLSGRLWSWDETTGIQFQLGQVQATTLDLELDNNDNYLASQNAASPYYPDVVAGTPLRLRAALGTMAGTPYNRWYVIQRNAQEWVEGIDEALRRYSPSTATDVWAALSSAGPTPYRGEVYADSPYAWWPCDDQPGPANVLPVTLLNAARGNTNPLNIELSPNGGVAQPYYNNYGYNLGISGDPFAPVSAASIALYTVNASSGWMYGDPQSTPSSAATGNSITASPGAAAWQQTGAFGNTGSYGWFLARNDSSFPQLSSGITVEGWFNYTYYLSGTVGRGSSEPIGDYPLTLQQPYCPLTLFELATGSAPVAVLQFAATGAPEPDHLQRVHGDQ